MPKSQLVLPVPYQPFHGEMNKRDSRFAVNGDPLRSMADLVPHRIHARVVDINDDTLLFRWAKDKRNHDQLQQQLNDYYSKPFNVNVLITKELTLGNLYVFKEGDNYFRCKILSFEFRFKTLHLIDYGRVIPFKDNDADLYALISKFWEPEEFRFAFNAVCRLADKNQCLKLNIPSFDMFQIGEDVEIFLLSSQEPYYSVVNSLQNPDAKFTDASLIQDLWPEHAEMWQKMTSGKLEYAPADRPTLTLSPSWIHGNHPTLVVVQKIETVEKIAVADLACSLRACLLSEILYETYTSEDAKFLQIHDPYSHLGINVIVVAHDIELNRYFRAQVRFLSSNLSHADLVSIDHPHWRVSNYPTSRLFLLPQCIGSFPRMLHYFPVLPNVLDFSKSTSYGGIANHVCPAQSVASLQRQLKSTMVDLKFRGIVSGETKDLEMSLCLKEDGTEQVYGCSSFYPGFKCSRNWKNKSLMKSPVKKRFEDPDLEEANKTHLDTTK